MKPTTLLVYTHGALSSPLTWKYFRDKLPPREKREELLVKYDLNLEPAEDIVEKMVKKIKTKLCDRLVLVGHSFGGVISIAAAQALGAAVPVDVVTIASPFTGSETGAVLRIFSPSSLFFKNVSSNGEFIRVFKKLPLSHPTQVYVTTAGRAPWIKKPNDGVITVESQLHYEGDQHAKHHMLNMNHFEVLMADEIVKKVETLL